MLSEPIKDNLGFGNQFTFEDIPTDPATGEWGFRVSSEALDFSCAVRCSDVLRPEQFSKKLRLIVTSVFNRGRLKPHGSRSIDAQKKDYRFVHRLPNAVTQAIGVRLAIKGLPKGKDVREDLREQFRFMNVLQRAWEERANAEQKTVLGICAPIAHVWYRQGQESAEFLVLPEINAPRDERDKHVRHYTALGTNVFSNLIYPKLSELAGGNHFDDLTRTIEKITGIHAIHDLRGYNIIKDVGGKFWLIDLHAHSQFHRKGM